jgi:hypothetical protein
VAGCLSSVPEKEAKHAPQMSHMADRHAHGWTLRPGVAVRARAEPGIIGHGVLRHRIVRHRHEWRRRNGAWRHVSRDIGPRNIGARAFGARHHDAWRLNRARRCRGRAGRLRHWYSNANHRSGRRTGRPRQCRHGWHRRPQRCGRPLNQFRIGLCAWRRWLKQRSIRAGSDALDHGSGTGPPTRRCAAAFGFGHDLGDRQRDHPLLSASARLARSSAARFNRRHPADARTGCRTILHA